MKAYLITGNTYPNRRDLRVAGALWDRSEKGYIVAADNTAAIELANIRGLVVEPYDATDEQLTPATGERLRAIRQNRLDRRRARLLDRAERAERRAEKAFNRISSQEREFLRLGEPVKVSHAASLIPALLRLSGWGGHCHRSPLGALPDLTHKGETYMVNLCGHYRPGKGLIPITKPDETFGDIYLFQNESGLWFATVPHTNGGRVSVLGEHPTPGEALKWARFKLSAGFRTRQYKWDKRAWKRHRANVAEWEAHKRRPESGVAA